MSYPILIIGGGLGGLCLTQALKKHNISFKLFEKDAETDFRAQEYRLRISELYALFEQTCAIALELGVQIQQDGSPVDEARRTGPPSMRSLDLCTVDRTTFRKVLLTGLNNDVFFGKALDHYTIPEDRISAHFTNGSVEDGALLVGADGVGSRVRQQLIPGLKLIDMGMRSVYGKTPMTTKFPVEYQRAMNIVIDESVPGPQATLLFEATRFPNADAMRWNFQICTYTGWHPGLRALFGMQDRGQTSTLRISSAPLDLPAWEVPTWVTLPGDAIHVMPPTGAMGAVTALRDTADLVKRIVDADGLKDVDAKVIGGYKSEMRVFAKMAIGWKWQAGVKSFGLRPIEEYEMVKL
ncbi:hypothetical protein BBP40_010937 [Aspergillus hancockii]|nr:hypothetical protein BBP40_010937 [Aspergillus hancockii]